MTLKDFTSQITIRKEQLQHNLVSFTKLVMDYNGDMIVTKNVKIETLPELVKFSITKLEVSSEEVEMMMNTYHKYIPVYFLNKICK
jgi:hypothetical protein